MDETLRSLITEIDISIKEFREKEANVLLLSNLIKNDDMEGLRKILTENTQISKTFPKIESKHDSIGTLEETFQKTNETTITYEPKQKILSRTSPTQRSVYEGSFDDDFVLDKNSKTESSIATKLQYQNMQQKTTFYSKDSCFDRRVGKIAWCSDAPDILASTYVSKKGYNFRHPDGLVLLWGMHQCSNSITSPLNIFEFTNTLTSISFVKNDPSLIVAGSNTGRIVVWDARTGRRSPVSISLPTQSVISNSEIIALKVTQSEYYSPIISVLSNCRICKWKLSMLAAPEEVVYEGSTFKYGNATCADISETSNDLCVFGTQTGNIVNVDPYTEDGPKATILSNLKFPITSISFHRSKNENNRFPLFLTTSFDCSLRIWNAQKNCQLFVDNKFKNSFVEAKWCPSHPSMYSTSDCYGQINLCDAVKNSVSFSHYNNQKQKLFTSMAWSINGTTLALGRTDGSISAIHIDEKLVTPTRDGLSKLNALADRQSYQEYNYSDRSDFSFDASFKSSSTLDHYKSSTDAISQLSSTNVSLMQSN